MLWKNQHSIRFFGLYLSPFKILAAGITTVVATAAAVVTKTAAAAENED